MKQGFAIKISFILSLACGVFANEDMSGYAQEQLKKAKQGDASAQYVIGALYDQGNGVPQNYEEAVKWYRRAAEQGYADAQYNLGIFYRDGRGVAQDYDEAMKWFEKSAEKGIPQAQYSMGLGYYRGEGVPRDYKQTVKWYRKAAEQGYADAQYNLGIFYRDGQGVDQDHDESMKWFMKAAEQGDAASQDIIERHFLGKTLGVVKSGNYRDTLQMLAERIEDKKWQLQFLYRVRADSYFELQELEKARDDYIRALPCSTKGDIEYALGKIYERLTEPKKAISYLDKCIELSDEDNSQKAMARYYKGRSLCALARFSEARAEFLKIESNETTKDIMGDVKVMLDFCDGQEKKLAEQAAKEKAESQPKVDEPGTILEN